MKKLKLKKRITKSKRIKQKRKWNWKNIILIPTISLGIIVASAVLAFGLYIIITSPDFKAEKLYTKESTIIYDKDGEEIARIGYATGNGTQNVELVTYNDLPKVLVDALVATEDSRFFQHNGFDAARFFKASLGQLAGQAGAGGASTLSMQVVKNTFSTKESSGIKGIIRKFSDIYMAVFKLEAVYTKEEIIEFYLNSQWLNGGGTNYSSINGVEQGSQYFFGKSVSDLTLSEAALLVGMFNNPVYFNPYYNTENASARRSTVLSLMVRHGYITEQEKEFAESVPVKSLLVDHSKEDANEYQAFVEYVLNEVSKETGDNPYQTPMAIYTTLDRSIQDVLRSLENEEIYQFANDRVQFGFAVTSIADGSILGMSAGRDYAPGGLNRAIITRQPGSTAKVLFDYGPFIEFVDHSSSHRFLDEPWSYTNGTGLRNYDWSYYGIIDMRFSVVDSRNIPALQAFQLTAESVGSEQIEEFVKSLGINYGETLYESAAIGGGIQISPLQESAAYAAFGRGGYYIEPYSFTKVVYLEEDEVYEHNYTKEKVMSEETAYIMTDLLVSGGQSSVAGRFSAADNGYVAAKSGTTTIDGTAASILKIPAEATPDHWITAYSTEISASFWYGYDVLGPNNSENNAQKSTGYLTTATGYGTRQVIFAAVGSRIFKQTTKFERPESVVSVTVEKDTYPVSLPSEFTPSSMLTTELFKSGYEPTETSNRYSKLATPSNGEATFDGKTIHLSWNEIAIPDAINEDYLKTFYDENYGIYGTKYYNRRIEYNTKNIGTLGYQVYLKDSADNLISLGYTTLPSYTYTPYEGGNYTFVIKSAYSIFKDNMSNGLEIQAQANIDENVPGLPSDEENNEDDEPVIKPEEEPTTSNDQENDETSE